VLGALLVAVQAACTLDGLSNKPDEVVNHYHANDQRYPAVSTFESNKVEVWQTDPNGNGKWKIVASYNGGVEFTVNSFQNGFQQFPGVAMISWNEYLVVWQSLNQDGSGWGIFGAVFRGTHKLSEFRINDYTNSNQEKPVVTSDKDGNYLVVWQSLNQDASTGYGIYAKLIRKSESRTGHITSHEFRVNTETVNNQQAPKATFLFGCDKFVVTWQHTTDGDGYGIKFKVGDPHSITNYVLNGPDYQANEDFRGNQETPAVTQVHSEGRFFIVWKNSVNGIVSIVGRGFFFTNPFTDDFPVSVVPLAGNEGFPAVAPFQNGWIALWVRSTDIYLRNFPNPPNNDIRVNKITNGIQDAPAAAEYGDFAAIATWESEYLDGSKFGIAEKIIACEI